MHRTKIIKKCLAQPRLLLRTFLLGMLLTGCFAVMADLGVAVASAQSLAKHDSSPGNHAKHRNKGQDNQALDGNPDKKGENRANSGNPDKKGENRANSGNPDKKVNNPANGKSDPGADPQIGALGNTAGSNGTSGAPGGGGVGGGGSGGPGGGGSGGPGGGGPGGPGGGGPGNNRPGLPPTGSDPGNNPLP